jgi:hypothetical protein
MNIAPYRQRALTTGVSYETFITRSLKGSKEKPDRDFSAMNMTKLILRENEPEKPESEESAGILLSKIKVSMLAALDRYLNFDLDKEERQKIEEEKKNVAAARSSDVLTAAIDHVLDITFRFEDRYKV